MSDFKNIYGQDLAIEILKSAISKKHIAPAYLFSGPEGVGRKKTAKIFIKAILDKNSIPSFSIRSSFLFILLFILSSTGISNKNVISGEIP